MKKYNVAVVGAGMVGRTMLEVLIERNFPFGGLKMLATREREEVFAGKRIKVEKTQFESFGNVDIALFAGTEGEKGASKIYGWEAVKKGAVVIDNGGDFRMEPQVPLVIPEVNPQHLKNHKGFIANPNCSTIQMVMALFPIYKAYEIERVIVSTYQAVSGTGKKAVDELEKQVAAHVNGSDAAREIYPHQIAFNVIPEIGSLAPEFPGYYTEEAKMIKETRKILGAPELKISATCVRVPVSNGHSESITVQCSRKPDISKTREMLASFPGVTVMDEPEKSVYPTALSVSGRDDVFVGRIRESTALENALDLWVVGDNIRKGAALNTVQIAEKMIEMGLL